MRPRCMSALGQKQTGGDVLFRSTNCGEPDKALRRRKGRFVPESFQRANVVHCCQRYRLARMICQVPCRCFGPSGDRCT